MRVGITGPSELTYNEEHFVSETVYNFLTHADHPVSEFWSGLAYGADTLGIKAAIEAQVPIIGLTIPTGAWYNEMLERELLKDKERPYELQVKRTKLYPYANDAYMPRNDLTVASIGVLLAFPPNFREPDQKRGGRGAGTWATVRRGKKSGRTIHFYPLDGSQSSIWTPPQGALV